MQPIRSIACSSTDIPASAPGSSMDPSAHPHPLPMPADLIGFKQLVKENGGDVIATERRLSTDRKHQFKIAIEQAKLAGQEGVEPKSLRGISAPLLLYSLDMKPLLIVKQKHDDKKLKESALRDLMDNGEGKEQNAEIAMYYYDKIFGFGLAPIAAKGKFGGKDCVYIEYLDGYSLLSAKLERLCIFRLRYSTEEKILWQKAMIEVFATLNFDPHDNNILVETRRGKLTAVRLIDAGHAIRVHELPEKRGYLNTNRELPGRFRLSKSSFKKPVIDFVNTHMTMENLDRFITKINRKIPGFWTEEMDQVHRATINVLRTVVLSNKPGNVDKLLKISSKQTYSKILGASTQPASSNS